MEWLHPVTLEEEVAVNVEVAAVVARGFRAKRLHHSWFVEVLADPSKLGVAQVAAVLALATNVVHVLAGALVGADHRVIAVDGGRHTRPDALAVVAVLDERLAAWEGIVHSLAFALGQNSRPATLTTGHGAVLLVLGVAVGKTVANQDRLEVDVALLVGKNFRGEDGDVVTSVRFTCDVEILVRILGELLEEKGQERIDVLASCDGVRD